MNRNNNPCLVSKNLMLANFDPNMKRGKYVNNNIDDIWWNRKRLYGSATLNYHQDFNLLLSVVKHIESLGYTVNICEDSCTIASNQIFIEKRDNDKQLATFNACYEFIVNHYFLCNDCGQHKDLIRFFKENQMKLYCKSCGLVSNI